jgi:hypothetical protein
MPNRSPIVRAVSGLALGALCLSGTAAAGARAPGGPAHRAAPADTGAHVHGARRGAPDSLTPAARAQLDAARRATASVATPEAARAAGFRPMFGHVPLQGEHYVRTDRVLADTFDVERPSVLMFAPVGGKPTLVGVAYAFLHPAGAKPPAGFAGANDVWHAHPGLSPMPGRELVMMHAWFTDAPDGPFARYNPWLPYLAAGLTPPSAAVLADSARGTAALRLGLALASATTPPMLFQWIARQGGDALRGRVTAHQAAITALVPRLRAAERAGDAAERARLAAEAVRHGEALVAEYAAAAPERPIVRRLVDRTVDEFLGRGHGIEEEIGALFAGGMGARAAAPGATPAGPPHAHHP